MRVAGCGRPAAPRASAIRRLSCAARTERRRFSSRQPRRSSASTAHAPGSIPSSECRTSRRPSATSPGSSRASACAGVTRSDSTPGTRQPASATFVGVGRCAMTANRMGSGMMSRQRPKIKKCGDFLRLGALAEAAGDVVLGAPVRGRREDLLRRVVLDEDAAPVAALADGGEAEEGGHVRHAGGLLHVVRDDHERVLALEPVHEVLDRGGSDRIQSGGRLVQQHDVGLDGDRARDAEPLLLAAGELERACLQPHLDLVPERRLRERVLDATVEVVLHSERAQAPGDVVVDRLRERVRLLEDHADAAPHRHRIHAGPQEVDAVVEHLPLRAEARHEVVHPVQAADERALAAARGSDHRGDEVLVDLHAHPRDRRHGAVARGQAPDVEDGLAPLRGRERRLRRQHLDARLGRGGGHCREDSYRWSPIRRLLCAARARAIRLATRTKPIRTSAAAHAWAWSLGSGDSEYSKILSGTEASAWGGFHWRRSPTIDDVKRSGAVSPATRATASVVPVRMPPIVCGRTTPRVVRQRLTPSPSEASRVACGTRASTSWVARAINGIIRIARAKEPASALWPWSSTISAKTKMPTTIAGTPFRTSSASAIRNATRGRANSFR